MNTITALGPEELTEEEASEVEDKLMGFGKSRGGRGRDGKKGKKTIRAIVKQDKENAEKQRREEAGSNLKRELEHFPFKKFSKEQIPEAIEIYTQWVGENIKKPKTASIIEDYDKEVEYKEVRGSGPGGQHKNKASTGVFCEYVLTGIYARSDGDRERIINLREANRKLEERLKTHIEDWKSFLAETPSEEKEEKIKSFMRGLVDERLGQ